MVGEGRQLRNCLPLAASIGLTGGATDIDRGHRDRIVQRGPAFAGADQESAGLGCIAQIGQLDHGITRILEQNAAARGIGREHLFIISRHPDGAGEIRGRTLGLSPDGLIIAVGINYNEKHASNPEFAGLEKSKDEITSPLGGGGGST